MWIGCTGLKEVVEAPSAREVFLIPYQEVQSSDLY